MYLIIFQHNAELLTCLPAELCIYSPQDIFFRAMRISGAAPPYQSACQREVSLVPGISGGVDKKTDGTGEVRGPCYGWQVCLFGLSLISCFPPSTPLSDSAYSLTWKWPRRDGSRPLFTGESTLPSPLTTQPNSKHMGQVWAYYLSPDKNNNWLICTGILAPESRFCGCNVNQNKHSWRWQ